MKDINEVDEIDIIRMCSICNHDEIYLSRLILHSGLILNYCKECFEEYGGLEENFKGNIKKNE